jgi:formate-dependent nitrite reductase membrane component NrfD
MDSIIAASSAALVTGYLVELVKLAIPDVPPWLVVVVSLAAGILSAFLIATASGAPLDAAGIATRILEGIAAAAAAAGLTRTMQRADTARMEATHRPDV